jgi:hypothetical protein
MTTDVRTENRFDVVEAAAFTREHLERLAEGTVAAVRVPGFLGPDGCTATVAALDLLVPPTGEGPVALVRFGPAVMDYQPATGPLDSERYHADADASSRQWDKVKPEPDPVQAALEAFGVAWGAPVTPATIQGRPAAGLTMREINGGALAHDDVAMRELAPGTFDQRIVTQLAFNVFVSAPEAAGEVLLWKRTRQDGDERYEHEYGYRPEAVEGYPHAAFAPRRGEATLFNAAHFHGIARTDAGRRISFAFFLGITDTGDLVSWA